MEYETCSEMYLDCDEGFFVDYGSCMWPSWSYWLVPGTEIND